MKKLIISASVCVGLILALALVLVLNMNTKSELKGVYKLETDHMLTTLQNDGGSYVSWYYMIDFDKQSVKKLEDKYKGFEGFVYQEKELYKKKLNNKDAKELVELIKEIINAPKGELDYEKSDYKFYILTQPEEKPLKYNDYEVIEKIEKLLKK